LTAKTYRIAVVALLLWLLMWIYLSWPAMQDDALIHLRYAHNLYRTHLVSYDGIHSDYGASSLLYIHLLAFLSIFSESPMLARGLSSFAHILLFAFLAIVFSRIVSARAVLARLLSVIFLLLLVVPSAVRWLDDGMETGLLLCFV
jgi:hypothetical protein